MSNEPKIYTTPVGRLVGGNVAKHRDKRDQKGQPILDQSGKQAIDFSFGVAFPKVGPYGPSGTMVQTTHWSQLGDFGKAVWETGHAAHPMGAQRPDFSWKFTDGDSAIPNKKGKVPNQQEGYPGHWVAWFSSSYAPKCYNANGSLPVDPSSIKPGHYIQVSGTVKGNTGDSPGVYLNHNLVAHSGFGPEISYGPDVASAGFGQAPLPTGASAVPVGGLPAAAPAPAPVAAAAPAAYAPPAAVAAPAPTVVAPNPGFLAPPAVGAAPAPAMAPAPAPAAPPAGPAVAGPQMTAKAAGVPYTDFLAKGWTDVTLRQHGYLV